jgi:hypothetical protein
VYEAYVTLGLSDNLSLTAGQQHFNFINDAEYGSFIADTLVRQMAECRDTGLALNFGTDAFSGGVFALNGEEDKDGYEDKVNTLGIHGSISGDQENLSWSVGAAYISNVQDANNGGNGVADGGAGDISAYSLNGSFSMGPFSVLAEMVQADDNDADTAEESAMSIEASMDLGDSDWSIAAKIEEAEDSLDTDDTEDIFAIGVSGEIYENTLLTINWESADQFDGADVDTLAAELRVSF